MRRSPLRRTRFRRKRAKSLRMRLLPTFTRLIRERDGKCMVGPDAGFGACSSQLQASHIYPVGSWPLLALYPLNCIGMCLRHHLYRLWHSSPGEAWPWFRATYPQWWQGQLETTKVNALLRKGMTEEKLRSEWKRLGLFV